MADGCESSSQYCTNECTASGAKQCSADKIKVQECRRVGSCYKWVDIEDCTPSKAYVRTGYTFTSPSGICKATSATTAECVPKLDITMKFVSKTANTLCNGVRSNWCCKYTTTYTNNDVNSIVYHHRQVFINTDGLI